MIVKEIRNFPEGLKTKIEDSSIPQGAASDMLNFLTRGDKVEIRRGAKILGNEVTGDGAITGLIIGRKPDGTQIPFRSRGKKVEYYDSTGDTWTEIGSDVLGNSADGEDVTFSRYFSLSGAQVWFNSPNSSVYGKIMTANPASYSDLTNSSTNFKGKITITQNRTWLWDKGGTIKDKTQIYGSKLDKDEVSDFTHVTAEAVGASGSQVYSGTLAFKAGGSRRTCFGVQILEAAGESFVDDKNGNLIGSAGGTGTINYTTGAYSVTFNAVTAGAVTADYYWEDSSSGGIADFTYSATRLAGEGFFFPQNDGGSFQNLAAVNDTQYCFHEQKGWAVQLSQDDTDATNLPFRAKLAIPYHRALFESADGIYYVDNTDQNDPKFRILTFIDGNTEITPQTISDSIDLSNYRFDKATVFEWGDFVLFACRTSDSDTNNRVFVYNKVWKSFDLVDYRVSVFEEYNGTLIAGDPVSNNVYTLFSGFDEDDATYPCFWEGSLTHLDFPDREKTMYDLEIQGLIETTQFIDVSLATDRGDFVKIGQIKGDAFYVDTSNPHLIGSDTLGSTEIGGGGDGVSAYPFWVNFELTLGDFVEIKIKFETSNNEDDETQEGIGYFAFSVIRFKDVRPGYQKLAEKYLPTGTS